jgi:hypothetical protein
MKLQKKLETRTALISIIGLGKIGQVCYGGYSPRRETLGNALGLKGQRKGKVWKA